jgi:TRAP-type uncharacterized transport system fused permease subunit
MKPDIYRQAKIERILFNLSVILIIIFLFANYIVGKVFGLMENSHCYPFLGCNAGFGGYDAIVHFMSGIMLVFSLLWIFRRFPAYSLLTKPFWKNLLIILSIVALICVCWEFLEYLDDHFRVYVLHMNLLNPNRLSQPSNADTVGDMIFELIGTFATACGIRFFTKDIV